MTIVRNLFLILFFAFTATLSWAKYYNYSYPSEEKITIDSRKMAKSMLLEVKNNYPELELRFVFDKDLYPDFFSYLAGSHNLAYRYYQNFHSIELEKWILEQSDNSIEPHQLFAKAVKIRHGDIFNAIVTIHEVLRNNARFTTSYIAYSGSFEKRDELFNKFVDIRGNLNEINPKYKGDHYGTWYRIWILMANQLHTKSNSSITRSYKLIKNIFSSIIAEVVKLILPGYYFSDKEKIIINAKGALVGYHLQKTVVNGFDELKEEELHYLLKKGDKGKLSCRSLVSLFLNF